MEASFTLQGTELHTFGPIYMSECFPKETVLNLGIATRLFADAPTGYPKNRKRAGDDSAFSFSPVSQQLKQACAEERGIAKS